ncbi:hypothetical protein HPULCUR_002826 [Helicostylum pulchrum]|uniref:Uncharacterized protein n=1 Tax=Helicostylum pulchrum TaxID=562976 RepID=A0ABP9XRP4_9FUNG
MESTQVLPVTYSDSSEYVLKTNKNFDYVFYYANFCDGYSREQTYKKLKSDVENSIFNYSSTIHDPTNWLSEQLAYNLPITQTEKVETFWLMKEQTRVFGLTKSANLSFERALLQNQLSTATSSSSTDIRPATTTTTTIAKNVIEADKQLIFNYRSVGSIVKSYGATYFDQYVTLDKQKKNFVALCLNGIIDFTSCSDDYLQIFTKDQWKNVQSTFKNPIKHFENIEKYDLKHLKYMQKKIAKGDSIKACVKCLKIVLKSTTNAFMYKILAHVINCYIERSDIFTSSTATEMDYLAKVWMEIFELLFAKENVQIKWGESTSQQTTNAKLSNNGNTANTIGLKVDARIITKSPSSDPADLLNLEASKDSNDSSKILSDNLKLAIESKVIVDHIVDFLPENHQMKYVSVQSIQISGLQAEICSLRLVDSGLYVHDIDFDISLPPSVISFGETLIGWTEKLLFLRKRILANATIVSSMPARSQKTFAEACNRPRSDTPLINDGLVSRSWTRGTFFLPTEKRPIPIMPVNFLAPPPSTKRKATTSISRRPTKK